MTNGSLSAIAGKLRKVNGDHIILRPRMRIDDAGVHGTLFPDEFEYGLRFSLARAERNKIDGRVVGLEQLIEARRTMTEISGGHESR